MIINVKKLRPTTRCALLKSRMFRVIERQRDSAPGNGDGYLPESGRWNGRTDKEGSVKRREVKEERKAGEAIEGRKTNIKENSSPIRWSSILAVR